MIYDGGIPSSPLLVDSFHKLSDHQRHTLYPLDFFLSTNELSFETPDDCQRHARANQRIRILIPLLIFDVLLLKVDVSSACQRAHPFEEISHPCLTLAAAVAS